MSLSKAERKRLKRERDKARRDADFLRAYGGEERVEWVKLQPSVVSGKVPCVNAHVRVGGMGMKGDYCWIVPLTDEEHRELGECGRASFEAKYAVDLDTAAGRTEWE